MIAWLLGGPRVTGHENLSGVDGPFLICPNHSSHFDFSALRLALGPRHRRRLAAAAAADYFTVNRFRWFLAAWLGSFPFRRTGMGRDSIEAVEALLSDGWSVLIFPEGTRSRTGEIARFKPGVGLVATRTGRPVVPVRILGIDRVLPAGARRPRRAMVEVRFGQPLRATAGEDARSFTARLEAAVRAL
jgi:1-acyl-sn-glycerol-3-phosphate acyltransferase